MRLYSILFLFLFSVNSNPIHAQIKTLAGLDLSQAEAELLVGEVQDFIEMGTFLKSRGKAVAFTSEVFFVRFTNGYTGVFKPEDQVWTTLAETAAYRLSKHLKWNLVPPTVAREIRGRVGSLQLYIETKLDVRGKDLSWKDTLKNIDPQYREKVVLFLYLTGQWDYGDSNILVDDTGRPILIDNGAIGSLSYWKWGHHYFRRVAPTPAKHLRKRRSWRPISTDAPRSKH